MQIIYVVIFLSCNEVQCLISFPYPGVAWFSGARAKEAVNTLVSESWKRRRYMKVILKQKASIKKEGGWDQKNSPKTHIFVPVFCSPFVQIVSPGSLHAEINSRET